MKLLLFCGRVVGTEVGIPLVSHDSGRSLDVLHTELAKIQIDGDYTKSFLSELKTDMRDMRDRMAKLEVRVDHLPSKGFIVGVVMLALTLIGALLTVAPKLQAWAGTATQSNGAHQP